MAIYYVKNGGNNAASGLSDALAWETFAYAASKTYSAGDSILFKRGHTFTIAYNTTWTLSGSGSAGNVITVGAYDSGDKPILTQLETTSGSWTYCGSNIWYKTMAGYVNRCWWDGQESGKATSIGGISASPCRWFFDSATTRLYLYDGSSTHNPDYYYTTIKINRGHVIFSVTNVDYWTFDNLEITGSATQFYLGGSADHLTIQNCNLYDIGLEEGTGSYVVYSSFYGSGNNDYLSFLDNDVDNHLNLISQNLPAEVNTVVGDCINMESNSNHWLIQGNTFNDCGHVTVQINGWVTTAGRTANDNIIEYNTFLNDGSPYNNPLCITGRTGRAMRNIFRYNYLEHFNLAPHCAGEDTEMYYNVFYHGDNNPIVNVDQGGGPCLFTSNAIYECNGFKLYNNLIKDCAGEGFVLLYFSSKGPFNALIKNNIVVNCGYSQDGWGLPLGTAIFIETGVSTTNVIDKNCVYNASYTNTVWYKTSESHTLAWADANTTEFVSNLANDPLVGSDFKIPSGSPCKDVGANVGLTLDYFGNSVPGGVAPDIGVHEYQGTGGEPEINITDGTNTIGDGGTFAYGSKNDGTNTDQIFTLENLGDANLTLSGTPIITITGTNADQFSVQAQPTTPIAGSAHVHFTLRFSPTSPGAKTAAIAIGNNDADENPYNINLTGTGLAVTYYVDYTTGDDDDSGLTEALAWKTIAKVNASTFLLDDQILFKRGETWREQLTVPSSGSVGQPITFSAYGTGDLPKIYGSTAVATWTDEGSNVWYATCATDPMSVWFVNIDDSIVWGTKCAAKVDVTVEYEWWWDDPNDRLYVYAASDPDTRYSSVEKITRDKCVYAIGKSYVTISSLETAFAQSAGIKLANSDHVTITSNVVHHAGTIGVSGSDGISVYNSSTNTISHNDISQCGWHSIFIQAASAGTSSDNIIEYNAMYDNGHTTGPDVQNTGGTLAGTIIRYNTWYNTAAFVGFTGAQGSYFNGASGFPVSGLQIYYNIIYDLNGSALSFNTYITNPLIANNTIYAPNAASTGGNHGITFHVTGNSGIVIKNNIAVDCYAAGGTGNACLNIDDSSTVSEIDNNLWFQSGGGTRKYVSVDGVDYHYDDFDAYKAATGWDINGLWEDPLFVNAGGTTAEDYKLTSSSPCINAGVDVGLTEDYEGTTVPWGATPDIGAYEYSEISTAVTIFFGFNF